VSGFTQPGPDYVHQSGPVAGMPETRGNIRVCRAKLSYSPIFGCTRTLLDLHGRVPPFGPSAVTGDRPLLGAAIDLVRPWGTPIFRRLQRGLERTASFLCCLQRI